MRLHQGNEPAATAQVACAGHPSGEHHHVGLRRAAILQLIQMAVDTHHQAVGRNDERIVGDTDQLHVDTRSLQDITGTQGLDVLEAVSQKQINAFHIQEN